MTVYVEVVLINNLLVDLLLGVLTVIVKRKRIFKVRQMLSAIIGAVVAVFYAISPLGWQIAIRVLLLPMLVFILRRYQNLKDYVSSLIIYGIITFALGGVVIGVNNLLGINVKGYPILGLVALGGLILVVTVNAFVQNRAKMRKRYKLIKLVYGGKSVNLWGLCDSGNSLCETQSGVPVIMLSKTAQDKLSGLDNGKPLCVEKMQLVNSVCGQKLLPLVRVGVDKRENCFGALTDETFCDCDVILQNTLF